MNSHQARHSCSACVPEQTWITASMLPGAYQDLQCADGELGPPKLGTLPATAATTATTAAAAAAAAAAATGAW
jgi:hypothetical protein